MKEPEKYLVPSKNISKSSFSLGLFHELATSWDLHLYLSLITKVSKENDFFFL